MIDTDKYEGHSQTTKTGRWKHSATTGFKSESVFDESGKQIASVKLAGYDTKRVNETYANLLLIADAPLILQALIDERAEVKRLREALYKCWKDSGQSLHYLQVELLNDQEYWYEQMICDDDSKRCGDYGIEDCECDEE